MQAIERFLPGVSEELFAAGGVSIGFFSEFHWLLPAGRWLPYWPAAQSLVSSTRPLLEHTIRQRVEKTENIEIVDGQEVCGLRLDARGRSTASRSLPGTGKAPRPPCGPIS